MLIICENDSFFMGSSKVDVQEFKIKGFHASEFHGALMERVFTFYLCLGSPRGAAKARVIANYD